MERSARAAPGWLLVNGSFVSNAALTADGGTIRTLAALTIPNNVTLAQGGAILDSNGFNSTFSGTLTGSGGLTNQEGTLVAGTPSAGRSNYSANGVTGSISFSF